MQSISFPSENCFKHDACLLSPSPKAKQRICRSNASPRGRRRPGRVALSDLPKRVATTTTSLCHCGNPIQGYQNFPFSERYGICCFRRKYTDCQIRVMLYFYTMQRKEDRSASEPLRAGVSYDPVFSPAWTSPELVQETQREGRSEARKCRMPDPDRLGLKGQVYEAIFVDLTHFQH